MNDNAISKPDPRSLEVGDATVVFAPEHLCWVGLGGKKLRSETEAQRYGVAMSHEYNKLKARRGE